MHHAPANYLLTDSREREYAHLVYNEMRPLSLSAGLCAVGRAIHKVTSACTRKVAEVVNAQAEARARDQRFSRTAW